MGNSTSHSPLGCAGELRRHGSYFDVDSDGFIIKPISEATIQNTWRPAVDDAVDLFGKHLQSALHSVYVRGSVAKGLAIEGVSDVDCIAAVNTIVPVDRLDTHWTMGCRRTLMERHPFALTFEMDCGSVEKARRTRTMQVVLQTQAVCVYGKDLSNEFPRARVGRDASVAYRHLPTNIDACLRAFLTATNPHRIRERCTWIMKQVLRAGFELVMERELKYTRDLYLCYESFARHCPTRDPEMYRILELAVHPSADGYHIAAVLRELAWLRREIAIAFGTEDTNVL